MELQPTVMKSINRPSIIACVSFETAQIVQPAVQYNAKRMYLFHYVSDKTSETGAVYSEFYDEVCRQLREKIPGIEIIECSKTPLWEHSLLLRDLTNIISSHNRNHPDEPLLINVSAGSDDFTSAGKVAALKCAGVEHFTVNTLKFKVPLEKIREIFYENGRPVGLTETCREATILPKYDIEFFEEYLVRSLRVYIGIVDGGEYRFAKVVIPELKSRGLWIGKEGCNEEATFFRKYRNVWLKHGWVAKGSGKDKHYLPTERGREVAKIFYTE